MSMYASLQHIVPLLIHQHIFRLPLFVALESGLLSTCRASKRPPHSYLTIRMVEGHQCHRVGHAHRKQLMGQRFIAQSPNGRFTEGACLS